jgi:hypothetical protein
MMHVATGAWQTSKAEQPALSSSDGNKTVAHPWLHKSLIPKRMLTSRRTYRRQTRRQSAEVMYIAHLRHHAFVAFEPR